MQPFKAYLPDESATAALGAALARALQPGLVIYLHGDLGAGKTALTRALIQARHARAKRLALRLEEHIPHIMVTDADPHQRFAQNMERELPVNVLGRADIDERVDAVGEQHGYELLSLHTFVSDCEETGH